MEFVILHELIEANGKTIRENNLEVAHQIPLGTLVEVKYDKWHGNGACTKVHARLWVVMHGRDCDGTPLYSLSQWNDPAFAKQVGQMEGGFCESSLTPVEITKDLIDGVGALSWDDD